MIPPDQRPEAIFEAMGSVEHLAWLGGPLAAMETAAG